MIAPVFTWISTVAGEAEREFASLDAIARYALEAADEGSQLRLVNGHAYRGPGAGLPAVSVYQVGRATDAWLGCAYLGDVPDPRRLFGAAIREARAAVTA